MFRPASEISSPESSSDESEHGGIATPGHKVRGAQQPSGSGASTPSRKTGADYESFPGNTLKDVSDVGTERHANLMTAALLEFYCLSRAADLLNAQQGSHKRFTRESPEVQYLGKRMYSYKCQFLSSHGVLPGGIDKDEWGTTRQYYRENLDVLGVSALEGLNIDDVPERTQPFGATGDVILASKSSKPMQLRSSNEFAESSQMRHKEIGFLDVGKHFTGQNNFSALETIRLDMGNLPRQPFPLSGSSPVSFPLFSANPPPPSNHMSRYAIEFSEVKILGRGSFGEVFHVKNHIDGQEYAVKKIPLSQRRLDQLQCGNHNQLENIMREIRTLARLEHTNVVRYYGAWVEQAHTSRFPPSGKQESVDLGYEETETDLPSHDLPGNESLGIVFENSESSALDNYPSSASANHEAGTTGRSQRRNSQATTASRHSRKSSARSLEQYDDEEIESIPRGFSIPSHGALSTFSGTDDDIFTDGLSYDPSKLQVQRRPQHGSQIPAVILHIQMSLHPISLGSYLNTQSSGRGEDSQVLPRRHCFHLVPSLRLMLNILSGVEYLHSRGIVHRDLKPANIFLSSSDNSEGCPSCQSTYGSASRYCHPRIGDFGLVADISHINECPPAPSQDGPKINRIVGTEFYRPPVDSDGMRLPGDRKSDDHHSLLYTIDESLDVYSLGVILFELLYRLNTKMERQMVLNDLTRGMGGQSATVPSMGQPTFPADFAQKLDLGLMMLDEEVSVYESLITCIKGMLEPDSRRRWCCADIKQNLEKMLAAVTAQTTSHRQEAGVNI